VLATCGLIIGLLPGVAPTLAASPDLVISQIYGAGGNSGALYQNDYVELYNRGSAPVDLDAYSVQYASATGTGLFGSSTTLRTELPTYVLNPGAYILILEAGGLNGSPMPNPNITDGDPIAMAAGAGKVALVTGDSPLGCNGGSTPCPAAALARIVDLVGYGTGTTGANFFEGSGAAPTIGATLADFRAGGGAIDTDDNAADFTAATPNPRTTGADAAPTVVSTTPVDNETQAPVNGNVSITFSEPVNVSGAWYDITCSISGPHSATVGGGPTTWTLDPDSNFVDGDNCTVTIFAAGVTDQDGNDPPDNMTVNFSIDFTAFDVCEHPYDGITRIPAIQGSGPSAAITGTVTTAGVVVGDFEGTASVSGFYLQDPAGDGDPATSDGIYVFAGNADLVSAGDVVRVTGYARERFNQTTINGSNSNTSPVTSVVDCGPGDVISPTPVEMPFASLTAPERYEGMLVTFPQDLVISEYFNYDRFGEIVLALPLAGEDRPFTGTAIDEPGAAANARTLANSLRRITLDDNVSAQNPSVLRHPNGDPFSLDNRFRGGDIVANATGVLGWDFSLYRIYPTAPADYTAVNPRPTAPDPVGGTLRVAAMNTLNFFLTGDAIQDDPPATNDPADDVCGGNANLDCRGWDVGQPLEFDRQRDKLIQALVGLNGDIVGLNEIENTPGVEPLLDPTRGLVAGLNAIPGVGPYAAIDTRVIGTDAIRVGLIYRTDKVAPVGPFKLLTSAVDPRFIDTRSRPVLAQTFEDLATGARFTVAVNHLKSKGSGCGDIGDPDTGDGQGNCNLTRKASAQALVDWLATDPTGSGDRDYLILGDLNSYAKEDPIDAIRAGADDTPGTADDYTNLIAKYQGTYAHSYVFDGQAGYLDHALASPTLVGQVTGAADFHIDSDEPDVVDYDTSFKPPAQEALYEANPYRASDHDPVVVGLNLLNFGFNGFQAPIDNPPVLNTVKAGQGVPVKFELSGDLGLDVLFGTPTANQFTCDLSVGVDEVEATASGASGLQYDPTTNTYTYVWKTEKAWVNQCRSLELTFDDGAYRNARFAFTK
jgi:predicted extracellular nuclease